MRLSLFVCLSAILAAACNGTSPALPTPTVTPPPGQTHASPTVPPGTSAPTPARTFALDEDLVASHEAACRAEDEKVLYGEPPGTPYRTLIDRLPRILTSQSNDIPVHVYADEARYVFCFPQEEQTQLFDGEFGPRGQGQVVPLAGLASHSFERPVVHIWFGAADPDVAWVAAVIPDVGVVEAPVVDGWFLVAWTTDPAIDSGSVERYIAYDYCGNEIPEFDLAGETICAPQ